MSDAGIMSTGAPAVTVTLSSTKEMGVTRFARSKCRLPLCCREDVVPSGSTAAHHTGNVRANPRSYTHPWPSHTKVSHTLLHSQAVASDYDLAISQQLVYFRNPNTRVQRWRKIVPAITTISATEAGLRDGTGDEGARLTS